MFARLKKLIKKIENAPYLAAKKLEKEIAKANRESLELGFKPSGEKIGRYKSTEYAKMKQTKGSKAKFGDVDLKLSGKFQKGIKVKVTKEDITVSDKEKKADHLSKKYGKDILGVSDSILPELRDEIIRQIKL